MLANKNYINHSYGELQRGGSFAEQRSRYNKGAVIDVQRHDNANYIDKLWKQVETGIAFITFKLHETVGYSCTGMAVHLQFIVYSHLKLDFYVAFLC